MGTLIVTDFQGKQHEVTPFTEQEIDQIQKDNNPTRRIDFMNHLKLLGRPGPEIAPMSAEDRKAYALEAYAAAGGGSPKASANGAKGKGAPALGGAKPKGVATAAPKAAPKPAAKAPEDDDDDDVPTAPAAAPASNKAASAGPDVTQAFAKLEKAITSNLNTLLEQRLGELAVDLTAKLQAAVDSLTGTTEAQNRVILETHFIARSIAPMVGLGEADLVAMAQNYGTLVLTLEGEDEEEEGNE